MSTKSNRKFTTEFPATNPQAYHKSNGEKALSKAKALHNSKIKTGLIAVRDPKLKTLRYVKVSTQQASS